MPPTVVMPFFWTAAMTYWVRATYAFTPDVDEVVREFRRTFGWSVQREQVGRLVAGWEAVVVGDGWRGWG
ncbi:MAG: hypothetical protein M1835_002520 [Candelina submexicana]|nr:MAG: hypothetical protein M1835_002520 [Candelina submexicana]